MKRNNDSNNIKDWTTPKIKKAAKEYYDMIHGQNACYNCKDIMYLDYLLDELDKRGIEADTVLRFN
jgi:hypothetical protein